MASPWVSAVVPAWFCLVPIVGAQMLSPTSIDCKDRAKLPVGVNSPIVVELEVYKAGDVEVEGQSSLDIDSQYWRAGLLGC